MQVPCRSDEATSLIAPSTWYEPQMSMLRQSNLIPNKLDRGGVVLELFKSPRTWH